jgi:hypothetical protein
MKRLLRSVSDNSPLYRVIMDGKKFETHQFVEDAGDYSMVGDFQVCPRSKEVRGARRAVCIKSAENLRRVPRIDNK